MKKLQLSRVLMMATILLLAVFEGYWLNKLYHDEYRNLKREVDVNFRDAMYKLQRRRFERDTNLVDRTLTATFPVSAKNFPVVQKDSLKKIRKFVYRSDLPGKISVSEGKADRAVTALFPASVKNSPADQRDSLQETRIFVYHPDLPGNTLGKIKPGMIQSVNVNSHYSYQGVPPPGLIEVILKQRAGLHDSGAVFIKIDSNFAADAGIQEHSNNFRLSHFPSLVTVRVKRKDIGRAGMLRDSLIKASEINFMLSGKMEKLNIDQTEKSNRTTKRSGATFNKVFINMGDDHQAKDPSSSIIRLLANNKTINDSIPVKVVDSAYKDELVKSNKKLPYTIIFQKYANGYAHKADFETDSTDAVITSKVFVGFNTPYSYQASFNNAGPFVLKKMGVQIGGSVLLLLFVLISFIIMYRNLMAQQRLTVIKNDFISNITHELKTPIATVNVAIEALRNFGGLQSPERTKEYLDISAAELQRLSLLVDKVLKLSMFENHEITLQKESFDLKKLIEEVMLSMKLQFDKQKAITELETTGQNFMIDADKLHITSVVYNLLDNALKYCKENPHIAVKLIRHAEYFELCVSDNGIGIPDAYKSKIFEQFFRVPSGDRHNTKGYGLGLSYVNHIIQQHNGIVEVESEVGKGSSFIVKIPFTETPEIYFDKRNIISKRKFI